MKNKIYLSPPTYSDVELSYVKQSIESGWISSVGPFIDTFQNSLSNYFQSPVLLTNSGTSAIHLALQVAGIQENDVVLCSNFTFAASAFPILYQKATPIFIGIEEKTWNINPKFLIEAIEKSPKKPKSLILTHVYGMPADLDAIVKICNEYGLILIEDAAEALGSFYNFKPAGSFGDFGIISFNGNKIITTSAGGCLIGKEKEKIEYAKKLASQAKENTSYYKHNHVGYNYLMSNVLAAIGEAQFITLKEKVKKRKHNNNTYKEHFSQSGINFQFQENSEKQNSNYWLNSFVLDDLDIEIIIKKLAANNIESRRLFYPLNQQEIFNKYAYFGNNYEMQLFKKGISLPSGYQLTTAQIKEIMNLIINS